MEESYTLYVPANTNNQAPAVSETPPDLVRPIPYARPQLITNRQVTISRQYFSGRSLFIDLCAYKVRRKPATVYAAVKKPVLLFSYLLNGQRVNLENNEKRIARLFSNQYAGIYLPEATYRLKFRKGTYWMLNIALATNLLLSLTSACPMLHKFVRSLDNANPAPGNISPCRIDFSVRRVISQLQTIHEPGSGQLIEQLMIGQIAKLLMNYESQLQSGNPVISKSTREKAYEAKEFIENNYAQPDCRVGQIVRNFNATRKALAREYKREFGISMKEQIIQLRMKRAAKLLEDNHLIKNITKAVGYENPFSFSRMFKKYYGCPPENKKRSNKNKTLFFMV